MPQDNLRVRVELNGKIYEEDLGAQTAINSDLAGLNTALSEQPGRFAWWATLEALARAKHEDLVAQLESLDAALFGEYQTALLVGGSKTPKLDAELVQAGRRTMEHRKDALITIASNTRSEMDFRIYSGKTQMPDARLDHVKRPTPTTSTRRA